MEFRCRLGTPSGEVLESTYVAESETRLRHELEEKGLYVLSIRARSPLSLSGVLPGRRRRVPTRDFLVFNQELATLLKAGMPLVQSLDILRQRVKSPTFKQVLDDVHDRVRAGSSLSEAFEAHGEMFPGIYTASLMAGEKSGSLEQVLRRFVAYVRVVSGVRRKTLSALIYPAVLVVLSLVVVGIIVVRVVPAFGGFYETFGRELPLATRVIVAASEAVSRNLVLIALAIAAGAAGVWLFARQPGRREQLHRWMLAIPLLGPIARRFATSQMARTLATLLGGGIPLVNALDVTSRAIANRHIAAQLVVAAQQVREGRALAAALADREAFPDVALKMIEVGEATGALQEMLNSLADFYDEEIETSLARFVTLIEPVMLVIMGVVIAALLLALYLPVFQLSSTVG